MSFVSFDYDFKCSVMYIITSTGLNKPNYRPLSPCYTTQRELLLIVSG